jgi:hypothetical protein
MVVFAEKKFPFKDKTKLAKLLGIIETLWQYVLLGDS